MANVYELDCVNKNIDVQMVKSIGRLETPQGIEMPRTNKEIGLLNVIDPKNVGRIFSPISPGRIKYPIELSNPMSQNPIGNDRQILEMGEMERLRPFSRTPLSGSSMEIDYSEQYDRIFGPKY